VPGSVMELVITSVPGSNLNEPKAAWMAAVPELVGITNFTPKKAANS